jgi:hypothetical protein
MNDREPDRVREYVDTLQKQVTHLKAAMDLARKETSEQVRTRIQQVKADMAAQEPDQPGRPPAGHRALGGQ